MTNANRAAERHRIRYEYALARIARDFRNAHGYSANTTARILGEDLNIKRYDGEPLTGDHLVELEDRYALYHQLPASVRPNATLAWLHQETQRRTHR